MLLSLLTHPFLMPVGIVLASMAAIAKAPPQPGAPALPAAPTEPTYPAVSDLVDLERLPDPQNPAIVQRFKPAIVVALLEALKDSRLATDDGNAFSPKPGVLVYKLVEARAGDAVAADSVRDAQAMGMLVLAGTSLVDVARGDAEHYVVFCEPSDRSLATASGELAVLLEPTMVVTTPAPAPVAEPVVTAPAPVVTPPLAASPIEREFGKLELQKKAAKKPAKKSAAKKPAAPKTHAKKSVKAPGKSKLNGATSPPAFQTPTLEVPSDVTA